jgi:methylated-DNA-[protein]-cysteine S-methyltransferase
MTYSIQVSAFEWYRHMTVPTLNLLTDRSSQQGVFTIDDTPWYYLFGPDGLAYLKTTPPVASGMAPDAAPQPAGKTLMRQLTDYFSGRLATFTVPVAPLGTPFQQRVWQQLQHIPYGQTVSYGELANRLGQPTASRAVGAAVGQNPVWLVIPCHRVIGQQGHLTGYAGGLTLKKRLLDLETL